MATSSYVAATSNTTTATYTLNPLDQPTKIVSSDGSISRTNFDAAGNATDACYWAASPDEACKPVGSSYTSAPTRLTTSTYDALNQRISMDDATTNQTTTYDPNHDYLTSAVYTPTGSGKEHQSLYGYDERHRLTGVTHQMCTISSGHSCSSTTATGSDSYAYDDNDNRTQVAESNGAVSSDYRYCYDAQNRLIYRNSTAACSSSAKDESYTYDAAGNRTQSVIGSTTTDYAYDSGGRLCSIGWTNCAPVNVTYDGAGRISAMGSWFFTYEGEGRMRTACKSSTCASGNDKVEFYYDGEGRRTKIVETYAAGTVDTHEFRYQGGALAEEYRNGTLTRRYITDESGAIVKVLIPSGQSCPGTYLVTYNGHGDALALWLINSDGTLTMRQSYVYSTWGQPTTTGYDGCSNLGFRFLYVGQYGVRWDNQFGLNVAEMRARHYSPGIGRFLQPDPADIEPNLFSYVAANPVTFIDSTGLSWEEIAEGGQDSGGSSPRGTGGVGGEGGGGGGGGGGSRPPRGYVTKGGRPLKCGVPGGRVYEQIEGLAPGTGPSAKTVSTEGELQVVFASLSKGGSIVKGVRGYNGRLYDLGDGTLVGLRSTSKSGGPAIDVNFTYAGITFVVHVSPWTSH